MSVPQEISARIRQRVNEYVSDTAPDPQNLRSLAAAREVLPLFCDFGGCLAIRPDGEIVSLCWDAMDNLRIEGDARIRNIALFQGSQKYPELRTLIPPRLPESQDCPHCDGTGIETTAKQVGLEDSIVCYCGGLGWLPSNNL